MRRIVPFLTLLACSAANPTATPPLLGDGGAQVAEDASHEDAPASEPDAGFAPNPCIADNTCPPGKWIDVTPKGVSVTAMLSCGNYGAHSVVVDPSHPNVAYLAINCQGIWKSTDYGMTWNGPINTGAGGATAGDCAGGLGVGKGPSGTPLLYLACIRGKGIGFWSSTNGGVDWTKYPVTPTPQRQDYYPPDVDPYDPLHLIMAGHEMNSLVESTDGGKTWTSIAIAPGMMQNGGTAFLGFIDMGSASATRKAFLYIPQGTGGMIGTWRTTDGGAQWTHVDKNERGHGGARIYQPDKKGTLLMAGVYSDLGWGVLRSTDYGATWSRVAGPQAQLVFGTPKHVYAMNGFPIGSGGKVDPSLQVGDATGLSSWTKPGTPAEMTQGPGAAVATSDGTHNILLVANYNAGIWRYVEP